MTKEEHNKILNDLKNCTSDADRMNLIVQLERDYTGVLTERDTASATALKAQEEANKFAKLNNELWLATSATEKAGQATPPPSNEPPSNEQPQKRTFEDLESKFD
jgi:K+/H+ antiporter YhaU regulatory subunit KhtT